MLILIKVTDIAEHIKNDLFVQPKISGTGF